jgi:hypothetical protein
MRSLARLSGAADDPGEMLLRLVTPSRMRCELYDDLLQRAFDAADCARERGDDPEDVNSDERRELDEVLQRGGVATLVGKVYSGVRTARRRIANPAEDRESSRPRSSDKLPPTRL